MSKQQISSVYANEADLLNMALFGKTAKQWRDENPKAKGNIRDETGGPYSDFKLSTGFAMAALTACKLIVSKATSTAPAAAEAKTHH